MGQSHLCGRHYYPAIVRVPLNRIHCHSVQWLSELKTSSCSNAAEALTGGPTAVHRKPQSLSSEDAMVWQGSETRIWESSESAAFQLM
jgi:hypothetical protein